MEFKELGKHRVFLGFFNTYRFRILKISINNFYKYRKQTSIPMDLHTFLTILFSENIGFSGDFSNNTKHGFSNTAYDLTNISHVDVFSKYLYSQGTSESKEIIFSDGLQFIYVRIEQFIFGNVIFKQCISCKRYWLYYINAW